MITVLLFYILALLSGALSALMFAGAGHHILGCVLLPDQIPSLGVMFAALYAIQMFLSNLVSGLKKEDVDTKGLKLDSLGAIGNWGMGKILVSLISSAIGCLIGIGIAHLTISVFGWGI